jgi:DNA helicase IV
MAWLTRSNVRDEVEAKVRDIGAKIDERRSHTSGEYEHEEIARVVGQSLAAGTALKKEWFYSSVGIEWDQEDRETWYVSRAPIAATFVGEYVVHWTHWIGRLCTQIREHLEEHGSFPTVLEYGPRNREMLKRIGPTVRYQFADGRLTDLSYLDTAGTHVPPITAEVKVDFAPTAAVVQPNFGLKDIVELCDLAQDDQIRGPMAGIYVLTGGPGVGKTSVALHRVPYLLLEQHVQLAAEVPDAPRDFFRSDSIHVVVWKEHLVPYLRGCLTELQFGGIAVHHVEDWIARTLRDYVRFGQRRGQYQIDATDEPEDIRVMKWGLAQVDQDRWAGLTESMLSSFLVERQNGQFHHTMANEVVEQMQSQLAELNASFSSTPLRHLFRDPTTQFIPTVAGAETAIQHLRDDMDRVSDNVTHAIDAARDSRERMELQKLRRQIARSREVVTNLREKIIERLSKDYPSLLGEFYRSTVVGHALVPRFGQAKVDRFVEDSAGRIDQGRLTKCDRYLLMWLIHIVTRGASGTNEAQALPQYSHTVVDEAQYYHPLVLRLLVALAKPPLESMTIVGDLEQKVTSDGGLVSWEDAGIAIERGKIFRLKTNYRWSKSVFKFLDTYRGLVGLHELTEPRNWASGEGQPPAVVMCQTESDQIAWLVDRVSSLRDEDWSIAVVVPTGMGLDWRESVIQGLKSSDIRSRWAEGEDVRECDEQIILTNYESIVGLEFDAVLLPGCERVLTPPNPTQDAVQSAWVALTRARKHVGISHVGPIAILDNELFRTYGLVYSPEPS